MPTWQLLLQMAAPFIAVVVGWVYLRNGWLAIGLYHAQILLWSARDLPRTLHGWNSRTFSMFAVPCAATAVLVYFVLPFAVHEPIEKWLNAYNIGGNSLWAMVPYFGIVHPFLEQAHWGRLRESRLGSFSHFAFAGYHGVVVLSLLTLPWVFASLLLLLLASWIWTYMARQARGGLLVPTISHIFADFGMIAAVALLVATPVSADATDRSVSEDRSVSTDRNVSEEKPAPPELPLELLREAIVADDPSIRCQAMRALGQSTADSSEVIGLFGSVLEHDSIEDRLCLSWGLKERGAVHSDVFPLLHELTQDDDPQVARRAIIVMSELGSYWPVCEEIQQVLLDPRPAIRAEAATRLLPKICDAENVLPILAQSLLDEDPIVRKNAGSAISAFGDKGVLVVDQLVAAAHDADFNVQITVIQALGKVGPPAKAALPLLRGMDVEGFARDIVDTAIFRISGEKVVREQEDEQDG